MGRPGAAPVLTTERLVLRPYRADDLNAVAAMVGDAEVVRHVGGQTQTREEAWRRMMCGPALWTLLGYGYWAVARHEDDALIGQMGFADFKRDMTPNIEGVPEFGYMFARPVHGQGFASEAAAAALAWADATLDHPETVAIIDPGNAPSIRLAERFGYLEREPARYKGDDILLFRRPRRAA